MDDLIVVAILDADFTERAARNDFEIALDRDPQRVEPEFDQHLGDSDSALHSAMLAVHANSKTAIESH